MKKVLGIFMSIILGLLISISLAMAEEIQKKEKEEAKLEEIVVTATKTERDVKDIPASVTVIGKEEIKNTTAQSIDELLGQIPGVNVLQNPASQTMTRQVTLRGVPDQSRTLILVDGVPIHSSWHGWVDWGLVPIENIEKIEIVRGPSSALYGSGAMGGVINIITRLPQAPRETLVEGSYGSLNTWSAVVSQGGNFEKYGYFLSGKYLNSDGYIAEKNPAPYNIKRNRTEWNGFGKFFWRPDEGSLLTFGLGHNDLDFGRGRKYFNWNSETTLGYLTYKKSTGSLDYLGTLWVNNHNWLVEFDKAPDYNYLYSVEDFSMPIIGGTFQLNFPIGTLNKFTIGTDIQHSEVTKQDTYMTVQRKAETKGKQDYLALFIQDEIKLFNEKLIFIAGGRFDWYQNYDGSFYDTNPAPLPPVSSDYDRKEWYEFSPKIGVNYHLTDNTVLRGSVGKGFQAPSLPRLYTTMIRPTGTIKGNPDLEPESMLSYELGIDYYFADKVSGKLTLYQSFADDFISYRTIAPKISQFDNINKVQIRGLEAEIKYKITETWSALGSYVYNHSKIKDDKNDPSIIGNDLAYSPRNKLSFGITYDNPNIFMVNTVLRYVGTMYSDVSNTAKLRDYWTLDMKVSKKVSKFAEIALTCKNLFDKQYDIPGSSEAIDSGRIITSSLTIRI